MQKPKKDEAVDSVLGSDAYFVLTLRDRGLDELTVELFSEVSDDYSPHVAEELWKALGKIVFGIPCSDEDET